MARQPMKRRGLQGGFLTFDELNIAVEEVIKESKMHRPTNTTTMRGSHAYDSFRSNYAPIPNLGGRIGNLQKVLFSAASLDYRKDALRQLVRMMNSNDPDANYAEEIVNRFRKSGIDLSSENLQAPKEVRGDTSGHLATEAK